MNHLLSEVLKIDTAFVPTNALNGANTGPYYSLADWRKALFVVEIGAMAAAATCALQAMQATDAAGGGPAKVITGLTDTITANTDAEIVTLTLNAVQVADTVTINGIVFTAAAAADLPNRVFDQSGADADDAASLAAAINHATAGVPGIVATTPGGGVVRLEAAVPGQATVTITAPAATITPATVRAIGYLEVDAAMLDSANGFDHVALRITNSAGMITSALLLRGHGRYQPAEQHVAAADAAV